MSPKIIREICYLMNSFSYIISEDRVCIQLSETNRKYFKKGKKFLEICNWASHGNSTVLRGLATLGPILQNVSDINATNLILPNDFIASLSDSESKFLSLPSSIPYQLRVWGSGSWIDNSYNLNAELLDGNEPVFIDNRVGAIVEIGRLNYRLPDPLYSIIELVANVNGNSTRDQKIETQAKIAELLGTSKIGSSRLESDEQIANIKIRHVAGFSASVTGSLEDPILTPVLFSKKLIEAQDDEDTCLDENQQILDLTQSMSFNRQFETTSTVLPTYVLGSGEYVYLDPSIRQTLTAFHEIMLSTPETKREFFSSPRVSLAARLKGDEEDCAIQVETSFIETAQFSDRVIGINKWSAPVLPWLVNESNEWGTSALIFEQIGNLSPVIIEKENLRTTIEAIEQALQAGKSHTVAEGVDIPVSQSLLASMLEFLPAEPDEILANSSDEDLKPKQLEGPFVVETIDGFEAINYVKKLISPSYKLEFRSPRALVPSTTLMPHQEYGVSWLISAYNIGFPGVLIADDMGLGKTLQALVYLAIYREQLPINKQKPCLIIAPTGLLDNWQKEITDHLGSNGLGDLTLAYGADLKHIKTSYSGRDTDFGVSVLDVAKLSAPSVILTTYESLRDYQISFSQVSFGTVIFDEIQKTKNPRSLLSRAAAAINGDFKIGLSGTPVENSLSDLWTVLDIIAPGLLKLSLQDFMREYSGSVESPDLVDKLKKLQLELLDSSEGRLPPILRRMKSEVFKEGGLPKKIIHPTESTCSLMPSEQESAYRLEVKRVQKGEIKMVQGLQRFKRVSMSPKSYANWLDDPHGYPKYSARLTQFFIILDKIKSRDEKALIFIETLELQPILSQILKERYSLRKLPLIINGKISGKERQRFVNEFQEEAKGFNVMLISPKAGGVGLTLTAANNVIHLERWWNPAVEDQCNDRAYRIGQKNDVNIYTPVAKHPLSEIPSFDIVLDGILNKKRALAESLFIPSELTPDDFSSAFNSIAPADKTKIYYPITLVESYLISSGEEFENYVASCLFDAGFTVRKTKKSWDFGCDLIARKDSSIILCQVKQVMSDKTLADGVDEIINARMRYASQEPNGLALITNANKITRSQMTLAKENGVIIILGESISNYGLALLKKMDQNKYA